MSKAIRLPLLKIAAELRHLAQYHGTNVALESASAWTGDTTVDEEWSLDVRLQVLPCGDWTVHYGAPDYDTDHSGVWGSDSIQVVRGRDGHLRVCKFDSVAMARGLINQAVDMAVDAHDFPEDVKFYYSKPRSKRTSEVK